MNIDEKQNNLMETGFYLGNPTSDFEILSNGCYQRFENATLYENQNREAFEVHGAILAKYVEFHETAGDLGFPCSDELEDEQHEGGKISDFEFGFISWTPTFGAQVSFTRTQNQQKVPAQLSIKENRDGLPNYVKKHPKGYFYFGAINTEPNNIVDGSVESWIWREIASEGSFDSINAYDDQIITWGKGIAKGNMLLLFQTLFASNAEIEAEFNRVGIYVEQSILKIFDTANNRLTEGDDAFRMFKENPKLPDFLIYLTKNAHFSQIICNAQWAFVLNMHAGIIKHAKANQWNEDATRLAFHFNHWYPSYSWNGHSTEFKATNGDPLTIIMLFMKYQRHIEGVIVSYLKKFADNAFRKYIALPEYLIEQPNTYAFTDSGHTYYVPKV